MLAAPRETVVVASLPDHLFFALERQDATGTMPLHRNKVMEAVTAPEAFDAQVELKTLTGGENWIYDLSSIVFHVGVSASSGVCSAWLNYCGCLCAVSKGLCAMHEPVRSTGKVDVLYFV